MKTKCRKCSGKLVKIEKCDLGCCIHCVCAQCGEKQLVYTTDESKKRREDE
jgi:hypothetical protein